MRALRSKYLKEVGGEIPSSKALFSQCAESVWFLERERSVKSGNHFHWISTSVAFFESEKASWLHEGGNETWSFRMSRFACMVLVLAIGIVVHCIMAFSHLSLAFQARYKLWHEVVIHISS